MIDGERPCEVWHPDLPLICALTGNHGDRHAARLGDRVVTWDETPQPPAAASQRPQEALNDLPNTEDIVAPYAAEGERLAQALQQRLGAADGERRRDQALTQVSKAADHQWIAEARATLKRLAVTNETLTVDALWEAGLVKPAEARAAGPVMLWGVKQGLIEDSGSYGLSNQPGCHRHPRRIWRSLVYTGSTSSK